MFATSITHYSYHLLNVPDRLAHPLPAFLDSQHYSLGNDSYPALLACTLPLSPSMQPSLLRYLHFLFFACPTEYISSSITFYLFIISLLLEVRGLMQHLDQY